MFIALLSDKLQRCGCQTVHAREDADLLIVQTTIAASESKTSPAALVAEDTVLLILLC